MSDVSDALMAAADTLSAMAARLRAKARETGDKTHLGTAAGLSLGAVKLIELSDATARASLSRTDTEETNKITDCRSPSTESEKP